jgi:integrase
MNTQEIVYQNQMAVLRGVQFIIAASKKKALFDVFDLYIENHSRIYKRSVSRDLLSMRHWKTVFTSNPFFDDITNLDIDNYIAGRIRDGAAKASINREIAFFKAVIKKAEKWDIATPKRLEIKFFKEKHKVMYFSKEDVHKMLNSKYYENDYRVSHLKTVIIIGLQTGMRRSEIFNLQWDQVDFDAKLIRLLHTKSGEEQAVSLPDELASHLSGLKRTSPWVITDHRGRHVLEAKNSFRSLLKFEGIWRKGYCMHTMRHTFASHLAMLGVSLGVIQECLRHADISTTMRYAHISDKHKLDCVNGLSKVFH